MDFHFKMAGLLLLLAASACGGASIQRDGFELEADAWQEAEAEIGRRAAFDLGCSQDQLTLIVLAVHDDMGADMPKSIGVVGCGKQATYVREFAEVGGHTAEGTWGMDAVGIREK